MINEHRAHLVHDIDKGLRVVSKEGIDRVSIVLTREDRLNQGGEFMQIECAFDQTSAGWSVEVEKTGAIGILYKTGESRNGAYRSRVWGLWRLRLYFCSVCVFSRRGMEILPTRACHHFRRLGVGRGGGGSRVQWARAVGRKRCAQGANVKLGAAPTKEQGGDPSLAVGRPIPTGDD